MPYIYRRDYFRSALNILQRQGYTFKKGVECIVKGNIPINSGTSSSSALLISWINFLSKMADNPKPISAETMAEIGYLAEVTEFKEAGGMMDHYSTSVGNVIYLESVPNMKVRSLKPNLGTFVLGDSQEPKDTVGLIRRVKGGVLGAIEKIKKENAHFSLSAVNVSELDNYSKILTLDEFELLEGNILNREILKEALQLFTSDTFEDSRLGELLNFHQDNLRDKLKISTPKIDRMIAASLEAGAMGGKINGSGGGGCMFVYAPQNPKKIAQAIENQGGRAYIITIDQGTTT
jgi:galactokinase